jgi:hypothetical protein
MTQSLSTHTGMFGRASRADAGASTLPENELIGLRVVSLSSSKPLPYRLVSLATFAVVVAWLAVACYAVVDLVSH